MDGCGALGIERDRLIQSLEAERQFFTVCRRAPNTVNGYAHDWLMFERWCGDMEFTSLPASGETVALYMTHLIHRQNKVATAQRHLAAIRHHHRIAKQPLPDKEQPLAVLAGARRVLKERPRPKAALALADLRAICRHAPTSEIEVRNRSILLCGYATALRRSELVRLQLSDIEFSRQGMLVEVRYEKQDQEGVGRRVAVCAGVSAETCPVRALRAWLEVRGEKQGPLFLPFYGKFLFRQMETKAICKAVKAEVGRIGLNAANYGAHSLRVGCITTLFLSGLSDSRIAKFTGHRSFKVLRGYFRTSDQFEGAVSLGL